MCVCVCVCVTGVGKMAWLLDFEGYSLANAPPMSTSIHCNSILQNHYPERLGNAVCWHSPMLFSLTWKVKHGDTHTHTHAHTGRPVLT